LLGVSFFDVNNVIAVGNAGTVIITDDAGATWTPLTITARNLYCVSCFDASNCMIGGESILHSSAYEHYYESTVIRLINGGTSWVIYHRVGENNFYGVSNNTLVGGDGEIFRTSDDGTTWDAQRTGPVRKLRGVSFTSSDIGTAVGHNGTILRTTNGGSTWTSQTYNSPTTNGSINDHLKAVSFFDDNNGFAVSGSSYNDGSMPYGSAYGLILRTSNGGTNWDVLYNSYYAAFNGVFSIDADTCVAVGVYKVSQVDHASWFRTTDGGVSWDGKYFNSITDPLTDIFFTDANTGILVGHNGRIMLTTNGAESWNTLSSGTTQALHGVCFSDANQATVVGNGGTILRTSDGGISWQAQTSGTTEDLYSVSFTDADNGLISGNNGIILKTDNGGVTWEMQQSITNEDLFAVSMVDQNIGTAAGDNGTILRTTTGGYTIVFNENNFESSKGYQLSQNYPNPFNTSTIIRYIIPERSSVQLTVYNTLGQIVHKLVNRDLEAGIHEITFDASHLPSGVYIYRLQAEEYVESKKLLYLK
jgi:photosystem II stability/assembly factor-like uncharacterized protein